MDGESERNNDLTSEALDRLLEARAKKILPEMEGILGVVQDHLIRTNLPLTPKAAEVLSWLSGSGGVLDGGEILQRELKRANFTRSSDTLNRVIKQLLHLGFLEETDLRPTGRRGRPPKVYRFHRWPSKRLHQVFAEEEWPKTLLAKRVRQTVRKEPVRVWNLGDFHVPEYRVYTEPVYSPWDRLVEVSEATRMIREIYGSGEAFAASFARTLEMAALQAQILAWLQGKESLYAIGTTFRVWPPAGPPSP